MLSDDTKSWVARKWYLVVPMAVVASFYFGFAVDAAGDLLGTFSVLAGDPFVYRDRWADLQSGLIPYVQMEFEHFPLTIVPIALAGIVSEITGIHYWNVFAGVTSVMAFATTHAVRATGVRLGDESAVVRFLGLLIPLLPLLLFRTDLLPVMCVAFALVAWVDRNEKAGATAAVAGILAKGWPVVLGVLEWWRGRKARAAALFAFTFGLVAFLVMLPGFRSGRAFSGIHQETIFGSGLMLWRHITGADLGILHDAGATYVEAASWMLVANFAIGAVFGLWALAGLRWGFSWKRAGMMAAALTLSLLLASPLLSPQFLVWPIAFLALVAGREYVAAYSTMSLLTILYVGFWDDTELWWSVALVARNIMLLLLVGLVVRAAATGSEWLGPPAAESDADDVMPAVERAST